MLLPLPPLADPALLNSRCLTRRVPRYLGTWYFTGAWTRLVSRVNEAIHNINRQVRDREKVATQDANVQSAVF